MNIDLEDIKTKNIYLSPYNVLTQEFENYLNNNGIQIKAYIDSFKKAKNIINKLDNNDDVVIYVMSPNYWKDITTMFKDKSQVFIPMKIGKEYICRNVEEYMGYNKEITISEYNTNKDLLDKYLIQITLENKRKYLTYPHIIHMVKTSVEYENFLNKFENFKIEKDDNVIDIGAHHGSVSIRFAHYGANVYAYEANPINVSIMNKNIKLNQDLNIKVVNKALSCQTGKVPFNFGRSSTTGSLNHLEFDKTTLGIDCQGTGIIVETITLNEILDNFDKVKLLKIDCEGCEYEILLNTIKSHLSKVQYIYIEAHPVKKYQPKDIASILTDLDFEYKVKEVGEGCLEYIGANNGIG